QSVYREFRNWCKALRASIKMENFVLRFAAANPLNLCHVLQHLRASRASGDTSSAGWYRFGHQFEPLVLDGPDYSKSAEHKAPLKFNVIEASDVGGHVGNINLLVATAPLLEDNMSA